MTFLLSFAAAFAGVALIVREARRPEFRPWPVTLGLTVLVVGWIGWVIVLFRWLTT